MSKFPLFNFFTMEKRKNLEFGRRGADVTVGVRDVDRFALRGSLRSVVGNGEDDELRRADQRREMMMVRQGTIVVRESTIGMIFCIPPGCVRNARTGNGEGRLDMERSDQVKADIPDEYEQHQQGALPPERGRAPHPG